MQPQPWPRWLRYFALAAVPVGILLAIYAKQIAAVVVGSQVAFGAVVETVGARAAAWTPYVSTVAALIALALLLGWCMMAWQRVGKQQPPDHLVAQYEPPSGLSPAALRYLWRMDCDHRALAAAIINLAIKGWLRIFTRQGRYTLVRVIRPKRDEGSLPDEELVVLRTLIGGFRGPLVLGKMQQERVQKALDLLGKALYRRYGRGRLFRFRDNGFGCGLGLWALFLPAIGWLSGVRGVADLWPSPVNWGIRPWATVDDCVGGSVATVLGFLLIAIGFRAGKPALQAQGSGVGRGRFLKVLGILVVGLLFAALGIGKMMSWSTTYALYMVAATAIVMLFLFRLLGAYTREGWQLRQQAEGFRHFLQTVERDRLNRLVPPGETPATLERYLPYALALDVEQEWAERLTAAVSEADESGEVRLPSWYDGAAEDSLPAVGWALAHSLDRVVNAQEKCPDE